MQNVLLNYGTKYINSEFDSMKKISELTRACCACEGERERERKRQIFTSIVSFPSHNT